MSAVSFKIIFAIFGAVLCVVGILKLMRPDPLPEENRGSRETRRAGLTMMLWGVLALLAEFVIGVEPCGPNDCKNF